MRSHRQDLEEKRKHFESLQYEVQSATFKYHDLTNALEKLKEKLDLVSMDQRELERQRQNRELLENLKRLFPGVVSVSPLEGTEGIAHKALTLICSVTHWTVQQLTTRGAFRKPCTHPHFTLPPPV